MYNLYKKVFNNITISKIIWGKVRGDDNDDEEWNEGISKLITTKELTIERLLSNKMYSLFDDYMDYYFKVVVNDKSSKYWQYQIFELSKTDIDLILSYKSMGFERFKLIYQHFGKYFKSNGNIVLLSSAKSGNQEIFQYLLEQGYKLPEKVPKGYSKLECGGNQEIFKKLFNFYKSSLNQQDPDELSCLMQHFIELNHFDQYSFLIREYPNVYGDKTVLVLLGLSLKFSDCKLVDLLFNKYGIEKLDIKNLKDIKFVTSKYPYETDIHKSSFKTVFMNIGEMEKTHTIDFKTLNYYLSKVGTSDINNYHQDDQKIINQFLKEVELKNYNYEISNYYKPLMADRSFLYYPTFQEFKKVTNNDGFNHIVWNLLTLERLSVHISTKLFNIEYMDYLLQYAFNQDKKKEREIKSEKKSIGFQLPIQVLDTKFEMVEFLFNNYRDILTTDEMLIKCDLYKNQNSFFGDARSARFYHSLLSISPTNKFFLLENGIFFLAFRDGYSELIQFYISIKTYSDSLSFHDLTLLTIRNKLNRGHFDILKFLVSLNNEKYNSEFPWLTGDKDGEDFYYYCLCEYLYFNYYIQSLYIKNGRNSNLKFGKLLEINDYQMFKFYSKLENKPTTTELSLLFVKSNYKILDYFVYQLNIKPSNSNITIAKPGLFKYLFDNNEKRLCWFIENDMDFIIQNIDNLIEMSCNHQKTYYLNLIFSLPTLSSPSPLSNEWKLNLFIKVLNLSIKLSNNTEKEDEKEIKNEKKKKEFDPHEYSSSEEESSDEESSDEKPYEEEMEVAEEVAIDTLDETIPWILKLQLNNDAVDKQSIKSLLNKKELISINRYYLEIIQPNLDQYKKLNSNIINLIESIQ